jgi:hypothetical protein
VSVNEKWLVMHMHVQLKLDELRCTALQLALLQHARHSSGTQAHYTWHLNMYLCSSNLCTGSQADCTSQGLAWPKTSNKTQTTALSTLLLLMASMLPPPSGWC